MRNCDIPIVTNSFDGAIHDPQSSGGSDSSILSVSPELLEIITSLLAAGEMNDFDIAPMQPNDSNCSVQPNTSSVHAAQNENLSCLPVENSVYATLSVVDASMFAEHVTPAEFFRQQTPTPKKAAPKLCKRTSNELTSEEVLDALKNKQEKKQKAEKKQTETAQKSQRLRRRK